MNQGRSICVSTAFLPPVSYMASLLYFQEVRIEAMETYLKQSYRNRTEILTGNGRASISIPVNRPYGNHTITRDILISYRENWKNMLWRGLEAAYNASPFFLYYKDDLYEILSSGESHLMQLNHTLLQKIMNWTGITTNLSFTEGFQKERNDCLDLRYIIHPRKNTVGMKMKNYPQTFSDRHGFQPNLSILDVLCNLGPDTGHYLKSVILPWINGDIQSGYDKWS